jgi:hypothetical protein
METVVHTSDQIRSSMSHTPGAPPECTPMCVVTTPAGVTALGKA